MSKEEKRMMLFDMQDHPEKYTDEQVECLLADEEVKEFFHELVMARMAGKKANPKEVDVDEAWKESSESLFSAVAARRLSFVSAWVVAICSVAAFLSAV